MKKLFIKSFILYLLCTTLFLGCEKKEKKEVVLKEQNVEHNSDTENYEIYRDLTQLNANLVYAEVFNMLIEPEAYEGKILKMKGNFAVFNNQNGEKSYAVIITDALACCQQGIEFKWEFNGKEPAQNQEITVIGTYKTSYREDGLMYNYVVAKSVSM